MKNPCTIAIIDDDDIYQFTTTRIIEMMKLETKTIIFSDGEEALDFMLANLNNENELPDIVLLDINMPIMDGFQFMDEYVKIKPEITKDIKIYMVSSSVDPIDIANAKKVPEIVDYIVKPINQDALRAVIVGLI